MLDTGATGCAALLETIDAIGAKTYESDATVTTFNKTIRGQQEFADFKVMPLDRSFTLDIKEAVVGDILTTEKDSPPRNQDIIGRDYLSDVSFTELGDPTIGLLIGATFAYTWMGSEVRFQSPDEPFAMLTHFGWTLVGPPLDKSADPDSDVEFCAMTTDEDTLQKQTALMYRHDFIMSGHEVFPEEMIHDSKMDEHSRAQLNDSIHFDKAIGHYKVALPWREGRFAAAEKFKKYNSYANAKSRLLKEKRKFERDPTRMEGTFKQIEETMREGHARILDPNRNVEGLPVWYLPIHVVTRPDKPGKFRICQDAASRVKDTYLNEHLCTGPDLLNSIVGVLLRFRSKAVAMTADIRAFFHMIHVADEDVAALRFLFFKDRTMREIMELEHLVHIFGASSSPPTANFTLKYHADRIRERYGDAIYWQIILSFYVDDFISSFDDIDTARDMRQKLTAALAEGGFELTKWESSHPETLIDDPSSPAPPSPSSPSSPPPSSSQMEEIPDIESGTDEDEFQPSKSITEEIENAFSDKNFTEATKEFVNPHAPPTPQGKILGCGWDKATDNIFVRVTEKAKIKVETQRDMLRLVHSVYDPLGLVSPYVVKGRMYYQDAVDLNLGYDTKLPKEILEPFNKWQKDIDELKNIKVPRWTSKPEYKGSKCDLIICSDASKEGYGVVAYTRRYFPGKGKAHVSFLYSKSHVVPKSMHKSPLKNQEDHLDSIPRLELIAAKLAAIVRDLLIRESGEEFENVYMFSDSLTVLTWICDFDRKFKTFENFRVKKIRSLTDRSEWRHIPSKENPADICSHGLYATDTDKWEFFLQGPSWLSESIENWPPSRPQLAPKEINVAAISAVSEYSPIQLIAKNSTIDPPVINDQKSDEVDWRLLRAAKKSTWQGKVKSLARVRKVMACFLEFRKRKSKKEGTKDLKIDFNVSKDEFERSENSLINAIQMSHFSTEITTLLKSGVTSPNARSKLRSKSGLTNLNPFLDENLILRAGGRIANSESVPYTYKFPAILPRNDVHVNSLINYVHQKNLHPTINHTFHLLRTQYHIIGGRATVNQVLRRCIACQKVDKRPTSQREGELPYHRVNYVKPFLACGIDVLGPFGVRHGGRGTAKRWVLLSTCMATRAISLLPLRDMTTPTLINALIKLHNQFPGIEVIYSDNGSNFKGASREIRDAVKAWNKNQIDEALMSKGITWNFNPPNAPHTGGVWERLVRSAKRHLKFILETDNLDLDTFETALSQVAAILNDRPLTYASSDINDMRVLSPSNFLYPYQITHSSSSILPPIPASGDRLRGSWRDVRRLATTFKDRWTDEYLKTLLPMTKWAQSSINIYEGQLVLMIDENEKRKNWRIARVDKILSSDHNHVRRVIVTTAEKKSFERHASALIALELDQESHEKKLSCENNPVEPRRSERLKAKK